MRLLNFLAEAFIGFFGITETSPKQKKVVNLALGGFLLGFIVFIRGIGVFSLVERRAGR